MERYESRGRYSHHFSTDTDPRLECACCGHIGPGYPKVLIAIAEEARQFFGEPITVNSGYRCPVHNAAVGGGVRSKHLEAEALDLACPPAIGYDKFYAFFDDDPRVQGLGKYTRRRFVHIDVGDRGGRDHWGY